MPVELAHSEYGSGSPLLILHGLFGSSTNWRGLARRLSESFHTVTLDLRNHGRSPWRDAMTYADMAADIAHFIESRGLGAVDLLGHSMGGKAAMQLALSDPALVRRLVVIDIAPVEYDHSHAALIQALQDLDLSAVRNRADADRALHEAVPEIGIRQFLLQNLLLEHNRFRWRINLPVLARAMDELTGFPPHRAGDTFDGDTLFVYGGRSGYVRPEHQDRIRRYFPHARLHAVAGAGHWVNAEKPDAVFDAVNAFLAR